KAEATGEPDSVFRLKAEATGPEPDSVFRVKAEATGQDRLPSFPGFQTIERLGSGGMGEVYKLKDLALDRIVAGKIVRRERRAPAPQFLQGARAMALFSDRRIVRIFEYRAGDPALIVMEYVDGFELGRIGPSLEFAQRA